MLDADKLLDINTKEETIEFFNRKDIIPVIDNRFKYGDTVYELTDTDIRMLTDFRIARGYDRYYDGLERRDGEAGDINGMLLAAVQHIRRTIDFEKEGRVYEEDKHKIICKIVK